MQTFQTAAVVGLIDNMSGPLKQLATQARNAAKAIEAGKFDRTGLNNYNRGLTEANMMATRHLSQVNRIHEAWRGVGAIVAGIATSRIVHKAAEAVQNYIPLERENRYLRAVGVQRDGDGKIVGYGYTGTDMNRMLAQQQRGAFSYGEKPLEVAHAQMAFAQRQISAATSEIMTDQALILAKALGTSVKEAAVILEGSIFAKGRSHELEGDPAKARAIAQRYADIAAVMSKSGAMTPEDIQQFGKYAYSGASAAGIRDETVAAIGMSLKRANMPGEESGTMLRQLASRVLSPTREGRQSAIANGIDVDSFSKKGHLEAKGLSNLVRERFGKSIKAGTISAIDAELGNEDSTIAADKGKFIEFVSKKIGGEIGATKAKDRERLAKAIGDYWQFKRAGVDGEGLVRALLAKSGLFGLLNFLGVKQGARGMVLTGDLNTFDENVKAVEHGVEVGRASEVAAERMKGLAFASDQLKASFEQTSNSFVRANEGWLAGVAKAGTEILKRMDGFGEGEKQFVVLGVTLLTFAGAVKAATGALGILTATAGRGMPGAVATTAGAAAAGAGTLSKVASVARVAGWVGVAITAMELLNLFSGAAPNPEADTNYKKWKDTNGGDAKRKYAALTDSWMLPDVWNAKADGTDAFLRKERLANPNVTTGGWSDSIVGVKPVTTEGDAKWGAVNVTGTVTGNAELHQNFTFELRPSAYFESLVQRAERVANMSIAGDLGTGLHGPGDNSIKPASGPTGVQ